MVGTRVRFPLLRPFVSANIVWTVPVGWRFPRRGVLAQGTEAVLLQRRTRRAVHGGVSLKPPAGLARQVITRDRSIARSGWIGLRLTLDLGS